MGFEVLPGLVDHPLELAEMGQHGEHCFDDHAHIPLASSPESVGG